MAKDKVDLYPVKTGLYCAFVPVLTYVFLKMTWAVSMALFKEAIGVAIFLFLFLQISIIKNYIQKLPSSIKKVYAVLFFIMCVGHCFSIPRTTFPFIPWDMFSLETRYTDNVPFFRYEATTIHGQKVHLYPEIYFRSLANGRIITDLDNLMLSLTPYDLAHDKPFFDKRKTLREDYAQKAREGSLKAFMSWVRLNTYEEHPFSLDEKKKHVNEILEAIAVRYDAGHPNDPIETIDIFKGTINIIQGPQVKEIFDPVWHLSLQGGQ